jgi:hypothetical protein
MATEKDAMKVDAPAPTEEKAEKQGGAGWPAPGEEGFVHPDGTAFAAQQLADNKQAAADRAKIGSYIHGAPLATPGDDPAGETQKAIDRAEPADPANGKK